MLVDLPSSKLTVGPWKSPIFIEETSLPSPMTARVELLIYRRVPGTRCVSFFGGFQQRKTMVSPTKMLTQATNMQDLPANTRI